MSAKESNMLLAGKSTGADFLFTEC